MATGEIEQSNFPRTSTRSNAAPRKVAPVPMRGLLPDESLANEMMPPLLVMAGFLSAAAFGLLLIWQQRGNPWPYMLASILLVSTWLATIIYRRGDVRAAGRVLCYTISLLPVLSVFAFGIVYNPMLFLAPLGVALSALVVEGRAPYDIARVSLFVFVGAVLIIQPTLSDGLQIIMIMLLLMLGTALIAWLSAYSVRGTIGWALEANNKAERRERLLRQTQAELESAIRERDQLNDTLYSLNQQLETARAAAEAAYRSKASFMAAMSHELRTPLNLIIGFSTTMLEHPAMYDDQPLPEAYRLDTQEIQRSGQHLLSLINDILDLAKIEAGRLELHPAPLALVPLLDEVLRSSNSLIKNSDVVLCRDFPQVIPNVLADEVRVRQILLNLLSNACKFTEQGTITLGAQVTAQEIIIWVRDTGVGIAPADQERIFQEFEQVEAIDSRKQQSGTGLGLSICRWLVDLHGGRLWLESEPGKGSTFYFSLPRLASA